MASPLDDLRARLRSGSDAVRLAAVKALAELGGAEALALLQSLSSDENVAVRFYARRAARALGEGRSLRSSSASALSAISAVDPVVLGSAPPLDAASERERIMVSPPRAASMETGPHAADLVSLISAPTAQAPSSPVAAELPPRRRAGGTKKVASPGAVMRGDAEPPAVVPVALPPPPSTPAGPLPATAEPSPIPAPAAPAASPVPAAPPAGAGDGRAPVAPGELPLLRRAAAALLRPSAELLLELLDSSDEDVVAAAAGALGRLGVTAARRRFLELLRSGPLSEPLVGAVADLGDAEAVEPLMRLYESETGEPFRHAIVKALWRLPGTEAEAFVRRAFESPDTSIQTTLVRLAGEDESGRFIDCLVAKLGAVEEYFELTVIGAVARFAARDPRVPARLIELLAHARNPRQISAMVGALAASGDPRHVNVVRVFLGDKDRRVRANAVEAVEALNLPNRQTEELLMPLLEDPDNRVRANAALVLSRAAVPEAARMLQAMLTHASKWYRASACYALGRLGATSAAGLVVRALHDPDSDVRLNAARALRELADGSSLQHLAGALTDRNVWVRLYAVEALGRAGTERGQQRLRALLGTETNIQVLAAALVATGRTAVDPGDTASALAPFLDHPNERVRAAAVEGLEFVMTPERLALLVPCLRDMDPGVRAGAVRTIWKFGEVKIVASLYGMLKQGGREARLSAAHILGDLGDLHRRLHEEPRVEYLLAALRQHPVYRKGTAT